MQTLFSLMRRLAGLFFFLAFALGGSGAGKPNVILITLDTVRADRMGFLGSKRGLTPRLDSLAAQAVVFDHAYSQAPLTPVSHATILTGTFPPYHGVEDFGNRLPPSVPYLPELLHAQGYRTAAFVSSIILDPKNGFASGFERGFDAYDAGFHRLKRGEKRLGSIQRRGEETMAHALEWLNQNSGAPYFLWIHLWDAHDPYDPPEPYHTRYAKAPYDGGIAYLDAIVGKFLDDLRRRGLLDDTIVAVASDHGESLGDHGEETHGVFLYDATIHVPLLLKLPEQRSAGTLISTRVSLADLAPTLLEAVHLPVPGAMQGQSLLPLLTAAKPADRTSFSESQYSKRAFGWSSLLALRAGHLLYVRAPRPELYDLSTDSGELKNIYSANRPAAARLDGQLGNFLERVSSGASETAKSGLDSKDMEKLTALGYVGAGKSTAGASGIDPKTHIQIANQLHDANLDIENNRLDRALPLLLRVVASDPQIYSAQYYLGLAYARQGNFARAVTPLRKAIELQPDAMMAHYEMGLALFETGDWKTAAAHFEIVVDKNPQWVDARYSLASVYARIDRIPDAIAHLVLVLEEAPNHYRANLLLGRILTLKGQADLAVPYLETAVRVQPDSNEAHAFLGDAYAKLGREADAQREHARAAELKSARKP